MSSSARRGARVLWAVLGVAALVALLVGSGGFSGGRETAAQQAQRIESGIKCPSCEDLSVADSSAPTAVAVRGAVASLIRQGRSDAQIRAYLTARYGDSIVLTPPTSGGESLVWWIPIGAVALGVVGGGAVLVRRRRAFAASTAGGDEAVVATLGSSLGVLRDQAHTLERSLADARAEHDAGDLEDGDFAALIRRDESRLVAVQARIVELEAGGGVATGVPAGEAAREGVASDDGAGDVAGDAGSESAAAPPAARAPRRRRSRRQRVLLGGGLTSIGVALVVVLALVVQQRGAGQTLTGGATLTTTQKVDALLTQAAAAAKSNQVGSAAQLYQQVLQLAPDNEPALANFGYLECQSSITATDPTGRAVFADGEAKLAKAVALAPEDYLAHVEYGTVLELHDHQSLEAVDQFTAFLADSPPASVVAAAAGVIREAYAAVGRPVPAGVPKG